MYICISLCIFISYSHSIHLRETSYVIGLRWWKFPPPTPPFLGGKCHTQKFTSLLLGIAKFTALFQVPLHNPWGFCWFYVAVGLRAFTLGLRTSSHWKSHWEIVMSLDISDEISNGFPQFGNIVAATYTVQIPFLHVWFNFVLWASLRWRIRPTGFPCRVLAYFISLSSII